MSRARRGTEASIPIASEPIVLPQLTFDRRNSKINQLQALRQTLNQAAGPSTIDYEVEQILRSRVVKSKTQHCLICKKCIMRRPFGNKKPTA